MTRRSHYLVKRLPSSFTSLPAPSSPCPFPCLLSSPPPALSLPLAARQKCSSSERMDPPHPHNFGWVVEGRLAGMAFPRWPSTGRLLAALRQRHGVGLVVTLTEEPLVLAPTSSLGEEEDEEEEQGVLPTVLHIPVPDFGVPTTEQMELFVRTARDYVSRGQAVVAHCHKGIGRTGTMLACYLVREEGMSAEEAIRFVREKRPGSITSRQAHSVVMFADSTTRPNLS